MYTPDESVARSLKEKGIHVNTLEISEAKMVHNISCLLYILVQAGLPIMHTHTLTLRVSLAGFKEKGIHNTQEYTED
jgi:hypothetical protein